MKLVPVMVIVVPPAIDPRAGLIDETVSLYSKTTAGSVISEYP